MDKLCLKSQVLNNTQSGTQMKDVENYCNIVWIKMNLKFCVRHPAHIELCVVNENKIRLGRENFAGTRLKKLNFKINTYE